MPSRSERLHVVLVTPILPVPTGNGLAMRAGVALDGLAEDHDVTLAVVPVAGGAPGDDRWAGARARAVHHLDAIAERDATTSWLASDAGRAVAAGGRFPSRAHRAPPLLGERLASMLDRPADLVVAVRTHVAGVALPFLDAGTPAVLDADEDDAATLRSIAALLDRRGEPREAEAARDEAGAYERVATHLAPRFDVVTAAAPSEGTVDVPNAIDVARWQPGLRHRSADDPVELLLVGNHDYLPNRDAAEQLVRVIAPAVAAGLRREARARVVGPIDGESARRLRDAGARVDGLVDDLAPVYRDATVAVVPLRAGGGTRVKILEAFAAGCPVVASPTAISGLGTRDGGEATISTTDEPEAVAEAVVEHVRREVGAQQAERARAYVEREHDAAAIGRQWSALAREVATAREPR